MDFGERHLRQVRSRGRHSLGHFLLTLHQSISSAYAENGQVDDVQGRIVEAR
jgi:hypothetical protein